MDKNKRLEISLLALRIGVFLVMLVWTIDKFVRPEHSIEVFKNFYFMHDVSRVTIYFFGILELIICLGFLVGFMKRYTYGAILLLHGISTISSFKQYFAPYEGPNILFFAAWPMLAACLALFLLRQSDNLMSIEKEEGRKGGLIAGQKVYGH